MVLDPKYWKAWLDSTLVDPKEVNQIVAEGAVEHFNMHTVDRSVGNARNTGPEVMTPTLFPEMEAQGVVKPTKESLRWLRTGSVEEVKIRLDGQLNTIGESSGPNLAERRLWVRQLRDRDDADRFVELIDRIRSSLKRKVETKLPPRTDQGSLF